MQTKWASLLNEVGIAVDTAEKRAEDAERRADIAEAAKEAAEAEKDAEKERADIQQRRADVLQADNAVLMDRARDALINLKIEKEERLRAEGINERLKKLIEELNAEKHYAENETVAKEIELTQVYTEIERLKEVLEEEQTRHAITEEDRDSLQEHLENEHDKRLKLEVEKSLDKRWVDEHRFCQRCNQPYRKWDVKNKRYYCLDCGEE